MRNSDEVDFSVELTGSSYYAGQFSRFNRLFWIGVRNTQFLLKIFKVLLRHDISSFWQAKICSIS